MTIRRIRPGALGAILAVVASGLGPLPAPLRRNGRPVGIAAATAQVAPSCPTNTAGPPFAFPTRRLSVGPGGVAGNTGSYEPSISADGSTVAFSSLASNLVGADTNNFVDVFVGDTATGQVTRASVDPYGNEGKWGSVSPSISGDGSKVAFSSDASSLAGGGGDPDTAVYFNANTRLVLPGGAISASTAVTFEAWFNTTSGGPILGYADQYAPATPSQWVPAVYVGTDGRLRGYFFGGSSQQVSAGAVNDGRWHHVILASTGVAQVLWLDGGVVGIIGGTVNHLSMTAAVVGQAYGSLWPALAPGWTSFNGRIDDVSIYRSYLPPDRAYTHFATRNGGYSSQVLYDAPWGYWRMGERWDLPPFTADLIFATSQVNGTHGFYTGPVNLGRGGVFSLDENDASDVYVRNRAAATTKLVSLGLGGAPGNGLSFAPRLSADGQYVAFYSSSSNLVPGDTNGRFDTFVANVNTGSIERVSLAGGGQANADSYGGALSGDGRYVAFGSDATNLVAGDTNAAQDVFVRDRTTGATTRVSLGSAGAQGSGASAGPDISGDGRLVAFYSIAPDLVAGDTNNTFDAFLRDTVAGTTQRVSVGMGGAAANSYSLNPRLSGDGRMVAYTTQATNVVPADANGGNDTMAWDRLTGITTLVSAGPAGTPVGPADVLAGYPPSPSFDGSKVAFDSLGALIAADTNFIRDVYLVDRGLAVGAGLGAAFDALAVRAESDQMGLEQFSPYSQAPLGTGTAYVNLANGNLVAQFEDQVVPAQGLNAVIRHTYNAQRAGGLLGLAGVDSGMGPGWNLSVADLDTGLDVGGAIGDVIGSVASLDVGAGLRSVTALIGGVTGQVPEFLDTDGTAHRFVRRGGPCTRWDSPPGVDLKVTEEYGAAGLAAYRVVRPDGVVYRATPVGADWRVTSVTDRRGNQLAYEWGYRGFATRLVSITHNRFPLSPLTSFTYDPSGRLTQVVTLPGYTAPDPATGAIRSWARTTTFEYEGVAPAVLTKVTQPDGQITRFDYPRLAGVPLSGQLASVTDARGFATTFAPDPLAPARLKVLTDRAGKPWAFDYAPAPGGGVVTTATTPLGAATSYAISARAVINPAPGPDQDLRAAGPNIASITDPGAGAGPVTTRYEWLKNRLVKSVDGAGNERRMTYNDLGLLTSVTEPPPNDPARADLPAGAPTTAVTNQLAYSFPASFDYPASACTPPPAGIEAVSKAGWCSTVAELARTTFAASHPAQARVSEFTYDAAGNMATLTQRANADASPNPSTDRTTIFSYYDRGALRTIDGPRADVADVTTFGDPTDATYGGYDRAGMPARITDALGKAKVFGYTPYGLVARLTDRDNRVSTYAYSERDKLLTATDPALAVSRYEYDTNDQQTKQTSPGNRVVTTVFDAMGRVTGVQGPGTITTSSTWNGDGTKRSDTNPLGGVTDYTYWPNLSAKALATPTSTGQAKALTEYGFDGAGRMVSVTDPPTNTAGDRPVDTVTYTPSGALSTQSSTAPMGGLSVTRFAFNAHGEQVQTKGPRSVGGVEAELVSDFNAFGEAYATLRRLDATKTIDSTSTFDRAGNQTGTTQATGAGAQLESLYSFDALGQLIAQTKDPSNPNHTVAYTYSGEGQQLTRVDKGAGGAPKRTTTYTYNPDNTRRSMVATDHTTGQTLATCNYAAGAGVDPASGYDADGNLLVTRTVLGTTGCTGGLDVRTLTMGPYDARSLSPSATQTIRLPDTMRPPLAPTEVTRTQTFTYDDAGQPVTSTHVAAGSARTTTFNYDPVGSGRLTSIRDWRNVSSATTYFASGAPRTQGAGSAATAGFDYRRDGSPERLVWTTAGASVVRSHTDIGYDVGALRTSATVSVLQPAGAPAGTSGGGTGTYSYDLLDRLQTWRNPFGAATTTYGLDDGGNIKTENGAGTNITSTYVDGRLKDRATDASVVTFTYNDLGEETARAPSALLAPPTTTTYDPAGHTASVTDGPAGLTTTRYLYDTTDRLIARSESTLGLVTTQVTLYFYWGAGGSLAEETDANGTTNVLYLDDTDGEAIAQQSFTPNLLGPPTATWTWLLTDATGNVATHLTDAGVVTEQKAYDPYGKKDNKGSAKAGAVPSTLGFQGHITDPRSGSVVLGARLYDPTTQRFTTPDVFVASALDVGLGTDSLTGNRYLFAAANPVSFYEDGHWPKLKLPNPVKFIKKAVKRALPAIAFVPYLGAAVEVVSLATGRDLLDGGRKMSGKERLLRTGMLAGGAALGVAGGRMAAKVAERMGEAKKLKKTAEALEVVGKAEAKVAKAAEGGAGLGDDVARAVGATCSFSAGTGVLMADGTRKPIADIEVGDMVLAEDPETDERGPRRVTRLWKHDDTLVDLQIDGATIATTEDHPYWNATDQEWQQAQDLDTGDLARTADGDLVAVTGVNPRSAHRGQAFNLTVDGIHTYYVAVGDKTVLVHDTCGPLPTQIAGRTQRLTNAQAADLAGYNGFRPTNQLMRGQRVFTNGDEFIVQDIDSHIGGTWKVADTAAGLARKATRKGTTDPLLRRIGP